MPSKRRIIWYHPELKIQARELRNQCTETECILWQRLKGKQIKGYDFHRQKPLLYFIVDFYCNELNLAIEINGDVHENEDSKIRDIIRQNQIEDYGVTFLRFSNEEIKTNIENVIRIIEDWIDVNG